MTRKKARIDMLSWHCVTFGYLEKPRFLNLRALRLALDEQSGQVGVGHRSPRSRNLTPAVPEFVLEPSPPPNRQ